MEILTNPAILFFVFGLVAGALRSDLEIPGAIAKFLSLYLLMALGLKGGFALEHSGLNFGVTVTLLAAMLMALVVPSIGYLFLKTQVSRLDAAAVAASYGSVSAVTFLTAMQYLEVQQMPASPHMSAALVLMESPAVFMAVLLANAQRRSSLKSAGQPPIAVMSLGQLLHEAFTHGSNLLLLGAMVIGYVTGSRGASMMQPFSSDLFSGMLAFFLLDMGLAVARNFSQVRSKSPVLLAYAVMGPLVHAALALALAAVLHFSVSDAAMLMVLSASASYIVVPAVLRHAIPEANPSLYLGLSLGVTFPLNILFGIPLYTAVASRLLS